MGSSIQSELKARLGSELQKKIDEAFFAKVEAGVQARLHELPIKVEAAYNTRIQPVQGAEEAEGAEEVGVDEADKVCKTPHATRRLP